MEDLVSLSPQVVSSHFLLEPLKIRWSVMYHLYIVSNYSCVYPTNKKKMMFTMQNPISTTFNTMGAPMCLPQRFALPLRRSLGKKKLTK